MKTVKRLLLGSAAGVFAVSGVQAADLPMAEPVEYVRICDAFGKGYFYIPGTQNCIQISGLARMSVYYEEPRARDEATLYGRVRGRVNFDVRTQTEYGTLRSYIRIQSDHSTQQSRSANSDQFRSNSSVTGTSSLDSGAYVTRAFVQFAGITAGLTQSYYDMLNYGTYQVLFSDLETQMIAYTATLGQGITATLSAEDRAYREVGRFGPFSSPFGTLGVPQFEGSVPGRIVFAGQEMPDIVGNFNITQAWGQFQLSGAVHQLRGLEPGISFDPPRANAGVRFDGRGIPDTEYGFAIQAGLKVNLPMIAAGDYIWAQGAYTDGAASYAGVQSFGIRPGIASVGDARYRANGELDKTEIWTVGGGFTHFFTPSLRTNLGVQYSEIDQFEAGGRRSPGRNYGGDFEQLTVAGNVIWSPVSDLDLGLEVFYGNTLGNDARPRLGSRLNRPDSDEDRWGGIARIERRF